MTVPESCPLRAHSIDTKGIHALGSQPNPRIDRPTISIACWRTVFLAGLGTAFLSCLGLPIASASPDSSSSYSPTTRQQLPESTSASGTAAESKTDPESVGFSGGAKAPTTPTGPLPHGTRVAASRTGSSHSAGARDDAYDHAQFGSRRTQANSPTAKARAAHAVGVPVRTTAGVQRNAPSSGDEPAGSTGPSAAVKLAGSPTAAPAVADVSAPKSVDAQSRTRANVVTAVVGSLDSPVPNSPVVPADSPSFVVLADAVRRELSQTRSTAPPTGSISVSLPAIDPTAATSLSTAALTPTAATKTTGPVPTTAVTAAPVAQNDSFSGTANTTVSGNVQLNDFAPSSKTMNTKVVAGPASGTLTLNSNGTFTFTPPTNFAGTATFTYVDSVGWRTSNTATVTITITAPPTPPPAANLPVVGLQGINPWDGLTQSQINAALVAAKNAGATSMRMTISWAIVEQTKGIYDWSTIDPVAKEIVDAGMTPLAVIYDTPLWLSGTTNPHSAPANATQDAQFGQFAAAVAQRYAGEITTFEIWNEENITQFWPTPDPARYTAVLKAAYTAIKAVAPNDRVIVGGLAPDPTGIAGTVAFVQGIYAAGGKGYFDEMAYHDYFQPYPVIVDPLTAIHNVMVANGDGNRQIWITEAGAPTGTSSISETQQQQAQTITALLQEAQQYSYIGPIYFYEIMDGGTDPSNPEQNFGLITQAGTPKLAYDALKQFMTSSSSATLA